MYIYDNEQLVEEETCVNVQPSVTAELCKG